MLFSEINKKFDLSDQSICPIAADWVEDHGDMDNADILRITDFDQALGKVSEQPQNLFAWQVALNIYQGVREPLLPYALGFSYNAFILFYVAVSHLKNDNKKKCIAVLDRSPKHVTHFREAIKHWDLPRDITNDVIIGTMLVESEPIKMWKKHIPGANVTLRMYVLPPSKKYVLCVCDK